MTDKKPVSELSVQDLALVVARHEYPDSRVIVDDEDSEVIVLVDSAFGRMRIIFDLNWRIIGLLWEREFDNIKKCFIGKFGVISGPAFVANASRSPESMARALASMWHPEGVSP